MKEPEVTSDDGENIHLNIPVGRVVFSPSSLSGMPLQLKREKSIEDFWRQQSEWSQSVFGTDSERGPIGPLKHLAKEAQEAQENTSDIMEYVDCLFLTIDASRRAGFTWQELLESAFKKLEINKKRKWGKSVKDEAVEHIRD